MIAPHLQKSVRRVVDEGIKLQASLARTPGSAFTGTLVVFSIVGFIPVAALRASPGHPGPGIVAALIYGVALINSVAVYPVGTLWHQVRPFYLLPKGSGSIFVHPLLQRQLNAGKGLPNCSNA